jgi:hypothetical protein
MASTAISAQGSILQIATGTGGAKTITGITVGNPTIITSAAHGFNNGDVVAIAGVTGTDAALLNGLSWVVTNKTTNTFAVQLDSTGKTLTATGTATPTTYTAIGNVKTFSGFDGTSSEIDKTNLASVAKEFSLGLVDPGHFTVEMDQDLGDAGQIALRAAQVAGTTKGFKLILPAGTTPTASFNALVKKVSSQGGVDAIVKSSAELRITGAITWA